MTIRILVVSALVLGLSLGAPARAQDASSEPVTTVDEIIVSARRTEAPIWQVTRGDSTLILVGALWLIVRANAWVAVGEWMAALTVPALIVGMLAAAAVVGGLAFATLRRATP